MNLRILGCLVLLAFAGCGHFTAPRTHTYVQLRPMSDAQHPILYSNARPLVVQKENCVVLLQPAKSYFSASEPIRFLLAIQNKSDQPLKFEADRISIWDTTRNGAHLKPYILSELKLEDEKTIPRIHALIASLPPIQNAIRDTESYLQHTPNTDAKAGQQQIIHAYMHDQLIPGGYWYGAAFEIPMPKREFYLGGLTLVLELENDVKVFRYQVAEQVQMLPPNRWQKLFDRVE